MSESAFRLSRAITPSHYRLKIAPDLDAATFDGTVSIDAETTEGTNSITIHAVDLTITSADISQGGTTQAADVSIDADTETVTLRVAEALNPGALEVNLAWNADISDGLVGFYRSTYTAADGTTATLAATQFEAPHARRAFPCFDEPDMKATFGVTLLVDPDHLAVANSAEVERSERDDGQVLVRFADTMKMSTYLVAWVVGPLKATEATMVGDTPVRVVHQPGQAHLTTFALETAEHALVYFENYYGIAYPGDKLDLVALPDFAFGAMENLGCVTFREVLLLVDPERATRAEQRRLATVINHELAHMWFGDLVTMAWWEGLWLNEAFATFMEMRCTDDFRPEWEVWAEFGLERSAAFTVDALSTTRPIEFEVHTPADAEGMFDVLTYEKGASVLRMLEQFLGEDTFRDGIRSYLTAHSYANTVTHDLWDALESVSDAPVGRIMDAWILAGGHPVLNVERNGAELALTQQRAVPLGAGEVEDRSWPIPARVAVGANGRRTVLEALVEPSPGNDGATVLSLPADVDWVMGNASGNGFWRTHHGGELFAGLLGSVDQLEPIERYLLVDDTWADLLAGRVELERVLQVSEALSGDDHPAVWRRLGQVLSGLRRLVDPADLDDYRGWVRQLSTPALAFAAERVDGDGDGGRDLHAVLFGIAGVAGADPSTRRAARDLLAQKAGAVDADLLASATGVVAADATAAEHADLLERWRAAENPQEEVRYLYALVDTPSQEDFEVSLDLVANEVRTQNAPYVLMRALSHPTLGAVAWRYLIDRWDDITERFPTNSLPRMLEGIRWLTDDAVADPEAKAGAPRFLAAHPLGSGDQLVRQSLELQAVHRALVERARPSIGPLIAERSPSGG
ncbi:MAG: M1 family metallopeptidase [Candidatus Microthrix sp.]|nr:M1 family metallopeptidase [Candidatus Microthrix sp.]